MSAKIKWDRIIHDHLTTVFKMDLCNHTAFTVVSFRTPNRIFVAIERKGAFFFDTETLKHTYYVSQKLNLEYADAAIIADWINAQTHDDFEQQGEYSKCNSSLDKGYLCPNFLED